MKLIDSLVCQQNLNDCLPCVHHPHPITAMYAVDFLRSFSIVWHQSSGYLSPKQLVLVIIDYPKRYCTEQIKHRSRQRRERIVNFCFLPCSLLPSRGEDLLKPGVQRTSKRPASVFFFVHTNCLDLLFPQCQHELFETPERVYGCKI